MDVTIKQRDVSFCNIKVLLIFLVVFGHLIEVRIGESDVLLVIYKLIYSVHMPLFVFLSGYFLRSKAGCLQQTLKAFKLYAVLQFIIYVTVNYLGVSMYVGGMKISEISPGTPFWHFWYLLSLGCWCIVGYCILELQERHKIFNHKLVKVLIIVSTMVIALLAGCDDKIGRELSLSRTLVFLPYFLAGLYLPKDIKLNKHKVKGIIALAVGLVIFIVKYDKISYSFLWQASGYGGNITEGMINRLVCYMVAVAFGIFVVTWIPYKRFGFSKIGADTFNIYIWHGFVVMFINRAVNMDVTLFSVMAPIISIFIIYLIYKVFKWSGQMYSLPRAGIQRRLCERK